ncbi:ABC transporter permease [Planotetraspora mira]|uniref:Diguanylate cyclase n=1 Tax=Planotetraspora mira TaxID=58121 RepID=A0A8J3X855_9ACTN|nr:ABC transporter permease [Planotetraspora mira]GII31777.1 diguanylate cyclase [Planotetraspora mira]
MSKFIVRRLWQSVLVVLGVTIVVFVFTRLLPGGPARAILGPRATPAAIAAFDHANGYDRPLVAQYVVWLGHLATGNLGYSYKLNQSVAALIADRLPKTVLLVGIANLIALVVAVPLGLAQAVRRNRLTDYAVTGVAFVFYSMPLFWLSILLVIVFSIDLGALPPQAPQGDFLDVLTHPSGLVLPVLTLTLVTVALFTRYTRSSAIEALTQDYVRTARAKGASTNLVVVHHVLRNSLLPIITMIGLTIPVVVSGALVVESVFNFPGMGLLFWSAAQTQDYPILLGTTVVVGVATALGSLLADLLYAVVDPRIRSAR